MAHHISRRVFVRLGVLAGVAALAQACATPSLPGSQPTTAPAAPAAAGSTDWAKVVEAAKSEGKVVVNTFPGRGYQSTVELFSNSFSDIATEHTTLVASQLAPRIVQERQANIFTWDVLHMPTTTALQVLRPAGVYDPIRPVIVQPEVVDDRGWRGGFAAGFNLTNEPQ